MKPSRTTSLDRGAALVVVLAFTVLITFTIVAYFSQTTANRQLSSSSASQNSAGTIARDALDTIIGDLKQEIVATTNSTGPPAIPARIGTNANEPNLTKRSVQGQACYTGGPIRASTGFGTPSSNSTTTPSLNGRLVSSSRWNKSYLLARPAGADPTDTTPDANFTAPDWIVVTRGAAGLRPGGATISTADLPSLANAKPTNVDGTLNTQYAVGRFAYQIFDEGGLIDINAAGYPSPLTVPQVGRKGSTALTDLSVLGISNGSPNQIDRIVGWKLYATTQPGRNQIPSPLNPSLYNYDFTQNNAATTFFNYIFAQTNGFLTINTTAPVAGSTDQMFLSRQELIQYRRGSGFSDTALQYLGTFSRELNRPSWAPTLNATDMGAATNGTGGIYAYKDNAANPTAINRNLNTVRVTSSFVRADGTAAVAGEPLLKTRFPLTKLGTLTPTSSTALRDFGLTWDAANNRWTYSHGSASRIFRLDEVAAANREPDFFEILKSVILSGSVGLGSGAANTFVVGEAKYYITGTTLSNLLSADYQIMQIGANIIDGWDSDNLPTFINLGGNELAGVENLPYLNKLVLCASLPPSASSSQPIDAWLVPSLWNPHQNGSTATLTGNRVRIALTGAPSYKAKFTVGSTTYTTNAIVTSPTATIDVAASAFIAPTPPKDPAPAPLATAGAIASADPPERYYGFHFVFTTVPTPAQVNQKNADAISADFGTTAGSGNVELQVQLPNTTYKTYQKWNIAATGAPLSAQSVKNNGDFQNTNKMVDPEYVALDPRTLRFGVYGSDANGQGGGGAAKKDASYGAEDSVDQDKGKLELINWSRPQGTWFTVTPASPSDASSADLSLYATNGTASNHYIDLDGIQRRGDWTTDASGTGNKKTIMYASVKTAPAGNYLDRPNLLSAPFQSVTELGQVFRDQPWKTLNFTSATTSATGVSGDAGLIDAFTLQDVPMTAGRTSLNTRQAAVLKAILSQTIKKLSDTTGATIITTTQRDNIVTALMNLTVSGASPQPMLSKAELVTRLAADAFVTGLGNKEARECVLRAFADACQTRTWNLMIDLIAQSGRYPATATDLSQFVVEGEKRYWLHVAIDRFTGEVIDQQLEAVYE